jgi:hypothetical protein
LGGKRFFGIDTETMPQTIARRDFSGTSSLSRKAFGRMTFCRHSQLWHQLTVG